MSQGRRRQGERACCQFAVVSCQLRGDGAGRRRRGPIWLADSFSRPASAISKLFATVAQTRRGSHGDQDESCLRRTICNFPQAPAANPQARFLQIGLEVFGDARYARCTLSNGTCASPPAGREWSGAARVPVLCNSKTRRGGSQIRRGERKTRRRYWSGAADAALGRDVSIGLARRCKEAIKRKRKPEESGPVSFSVLGSGTVAGGGGWVAGDQSYGEASRLARMRARDQRLPTRPAVGRPCTLQPVGVGCMLSCGGWSEKMKTSGVPVATSGGWR